MQSARRRPLLPVGALTATCQNCAGRCKGALRLLAGPHKTRRECSGVQAARPLGPAARPLGTLLSNVAELGSPVAAAGEQEQGFSVAVEGRTRRQGWSHHASLVAAHTLRLGQPRTNMASTRAWCMDNTKSCQGSVWPCISTHIGATSTVVLAWSSCVPSRQRAQVCMNLGGEAAVSVAWRQT